MCVTRSMPGAADVSGSSRIPLCRRNRRTRLRRASDDPEIADVGMFAAGSPAAPRDRNAGMTSVGRNAGRGESLDGEELRQVIGPSRKHWVTRPSPSADDVERAVGTPSHPRGSRHRPASAMTRRLQANRRCRPVRNQQPPVCRVHSRMSDRIGELNGQDAPCLHVDAQDRAGWQVRRNPHCSGHSAANHANGQRHTSLA